jgi:hypothetical protein
MSNMVISSQVLHSSVCLFVDLYFYLSTCVFVFPLLDSKQQICRIVPSTTLQYETTSKIYSESTRKTYFTQQYIKQLIFKSLYIIKVATSTSTSIKIFDYSLKLIYFYTQNIADIFNFFFYFFQNL